ncbi:MULTISPECIES: GGDEF domain-containing protein [Thalassospira]|uniref:diguanylate cyclase n=1 Tax=Thalassospira aquimaris TaxID=3037796 RepID=A0ABT6G7K5_9PROT|nr:MULTISPECIES: diguanylate cyclase [Thalassospira]MDG4717872.1 diguanylate cyclase [Thalassospira sp. FZY0004]
MSTGSDFPNLVSGSNQQNKVLVADDDPMMGEFLGAILEQIADVTVVSSGEAALKALETDAYDVVLLDVEMPGMGGLEACKAIKSSPDTSHISVIIVTARIGDKMEVDALDLGATDFIVKPFVAKIVLARVRNHLIMQAQARQLRLLSMSDGLTGIANRRCFDQTLENECSRAARTNTPLSLLLIDVDRFKQYNDHYGHSQGDECLKKIAKALTLSARRAGDLVARVGGEEFAFIFPNTDKDSLIAIAQSVSMHVSELALSHIDGIDGKVTISIGGTTLDGTNQPISGSAIYMKADELLYKAKEAGRNCAVIE